MDSAEAADKQLREFVDGILTEKNLPGLTDDARPVVIDDMVEAIQKLIERALLDALPDEKLQEIEALVDSQQVTNEAIKKIIESSGIDAKQITLDTMLRFRDLYLEGLQGNGA